MEISKKLEKYIKNKIEELCNDKGQIEYYVDYRDKIDSDIFKAKVDSYKDYIENLSKEETNIMTFKEYLMESFEEVNWAGEMYEYVDDDFEEQLYKDAPEDLKEELENTDDLYDIFSSLGYNGLDFNKYIDDLLDNSRVNLEIMFATPNEENRDLCSITNAFGSNQELFLPKYRIDAFEDDDLKDYDNCLTYLIHQQGHSVNEVFNNIAKNPTGYSESNLPFIKSITDEIANNYSDGPCTLVTLASFNGNDFIDFVNDLYNPEEKDKYPYLKINKDVMLGLHDSWAGTTSMLGINLDKDFIIPKEYVRDILVEGARENQRQGYTVDEVCGLVGSCWKDNVVTDTDEKPIMYQETNENIIENLKSLEESEEM